MPPKSKKSKASQRVEEPEDFDDVEIEDAGEEASDSGEAEEIVNLSEEEAPKKKSRAKAKASSTTKGKTAKKTTKTSKSKASEPVEDELEEIEVNSDDDSVKPAASSHTTRTKQQSHSSSSQPHHGRGQSQGQPAPRIDVTTPIKDLSIQDILRHLIYVGQTTYNPCLRHGASDLLQELTGGSRRGPRQARTGSKTNYSGPGRATYGSKTNYEPRSGGSNAGLLGPVDRKSVSQNQSVQGPRTGPNRRNREEIYER
jgi:hypothetical protein